MIKEIKPAVAQSSEGKVCKFLVGYDNTQLLTYTWVNDSLGSFYICTYFRNKYWVNRSSSFRLIIPLVAVFWLFSNSSCTSLPKYKFSWHVPETSKNNQTLCVEISSAKTIWRSCVAITCTSNMKLHSDLCTSVYESKICD